MKQTLIKLSKKLINLQLEPETSKPLSKNWENRDRNQQMHR